MSSPVAESDLMDTEIGKSKASVVRRAEDDPEIVPPKKMMKLDPESKDESEKEEDLSETEYQDTHQLDDEDEEDILGSSDEEEQDEQEEDEEIDVEDDSTQEELDDEGPYNDHLLAIQRDQDEIDVLNNQANQEILQVNRKWNAKKQPAYQKRNEKIAKIPGFWALVFSSHSELKKVFTYEDLKALENMSKLEIQEDSDEDGNSRMKMKFIFNPNPYFVNNLIEKVYIYPDPQSDLPPSCSCTKIQWRPDKNLVEKFPTSFFSWFCDQQDASSDDISEIIKDEIWNNPLQFYNKQNPSDTENDVDEDSEEESDEDDDDCVITGSKDAPTIDIIDDTSEEEEEVDLSEEDEEENWRSGGKTGGKSGGKSGKQPHNQVYQDDEEEDYEEDDDEDIEVQEDIEEQDLQEEQDLHEEQELDGEEEEVIVDEEIENSNDALLDDEDQIEDGDIYQNVNNHNSSNLEEDEDLLSEEDDEDNQEEQDDVNSDVINQDSEDSAPPTKNGS